MNKIIIITGFSASGKDTLARNLEKEGCHFIVSHTTRPMRPGEFQGNPYWFIKKEDFLAMAEKGEFIEHRQYNTLVNNVPDIWHYGVFKESVSDNRMNVVVLDLLGAMEFKKYFGDRCITFFLYTDTETRRQRCIKRGDYDESEFNRRNKDDEEKFAPELINEVVDYKLKSYDEDLVFADVLDYIAMYTGVKEQVETYKWNPNNQDWEKRD